MNERKLQKLFDAARTDAAPAAPAHFESRVMREITSGARESREVSLFDLLGAIFPRVTIAAASLIVLCIAGDLLLSHKIGDISTAAAQLSEEWLIAANDLPL